MAIQTSARTCHKRRTTKNHALDACPHIRCKSCLSLTLLATSDAIQSRAIQTTCVTRGPYLAWELVRKQLEQALIVTLLASQEAVSCSTSYLSREEELNTLSCFISSAGLWAQALLLCCEASSLFVEQILPLAIQPSRTLFTKSLGRSRTEQRTDWACLKIVGAASFTGPRRHGPTRIRGILATTSSCHGASQDDCHFAFSRADSPLNCSVLLWCARKTWKHRTQPSRLAQGPPKCSARWQD